MKKEITQTLKTEISATLISKNGVLVQQFQKDFKHLTGHPLEYRKYGFQSLIDMLESMPDVVSIEYSETNDQHKLYGIPVKDTFMSSFLKKNKAREPRDKPKNPRGGSKNCDGKGQKSQSGKSSSSPSDDWMKDPRIQQWNEEVQPNMKGLYALCMPHNDKQPREEFSGVFSQYGEIQEIAMTPRFCFLRYKHKKEALYALYCQQRAYDIRIPTEKNNPKHVIKQDMQAEPPRTDKIEVYVGNLPKTSMIKWRHEFEELFTDFPVQGFRYTCSEDKHFAFVEFPTADEAETAVLHLQNMKLFGQTLVIQLAYKNSSQGKHDFKDNSDVIMATLTRDGGAGTKKSLGSLQYDEDSDQEMPDLEEDYDSDDSLPSLEGPSDEEEEEDYVSQLDDFEKLDPFSEHRGHDKQWDDTALNSKHSGQHSQDVFVSDENKQVPLNTSHSKTSSPLRPGDIQKQKSKFNSGNPARSFQKKTHSQTYHPKEGEEHLDKIFISVENFPYETTVENLSEIFQKYSIDDILLRDVKEQGKQRSQAKLLFTNERDAWRCLKEMDGQIYKNRKLLLFLHNPERPPVNKQPSQKTLNQSNQSLGRLANQHRGKLSNQFPRNPGHQHNGTQGDREQVNQGQRDHGGRPVRHYSGETGDQSGESVAELYNDSFKQPYGRHSRETLLCRITQNSGDELDERTVTIKQPHNAPDIRGPTGQRGGHRGQVPFQGPRFQQAGPRLYQNPKQFQNEGMNSNVNTNWGPRSLLGPRPNQDHSILGPAPIFRVQPPYRGPQPGYGGPQPSYGGPQPPYGICRPPYRGPQPFQSPRFGGHPAFRGHRPNNNAGVAPRGIRLNIRPNLSEELRQRGSAKTESKLSRDSPERTTTNCSADDMLYHHLGSYTNCFPGRRNTICLQPNEEIFLQVTNIVDSQHFWGHAICKETETDMNQMMYEMEAMKSETELKPYVTGSKKCVSKYQQDWCRGWVQEVSDGEAKVFYVDYANIEKIPLSQLRSVDEKYWEILPQALPFKILENRTDPVHNLVKSLVVATVVKHGNDPGPFVKICITGAIFSEKVDMVEELEGRLASEQGILKSAGDASSGSSTSSVRQNKTVSFS